VRLFLAIHPPRPVLDDLARAVAELDVSRVGARVTARPLWHITLAFLGEVPDERAADAAVAVQRAVAGQRAPSLRLAGGGRFGRGRFTVLWAGVQGELRPLRQAVTRELRRGRLPFDAKRFHPHLTLARPGDRVTAAQLAGDVAALAGYQGPEWIVDAVRLMRSHLGPNPSHEPLHVAPLDTVPDVGRSTAR
jgi:2'-5' RNA ligase